MSEKEGVPFLDLSPSLTALKSNYYPFTEGPTHPYQHYDSNGHWLFAACLAELLIHQRLVPFQPSGK
jgi:hypothetical protein